MAINSGNICANGICQKHYKKQQEFLVVSNFIPSQKQKDQLIANPLLSNSSSNSSSSSNACCALLPLWMGDFVEVFGTKGDWCFGRRLEEPNKFGLFPRSHIQQAKTSAEIVGNRGGCSGKIETEKIAKEIGQSVKAWWEGTKMGIGNGQCVSEQSAQQMMLIKQLMMVRRRLRSDTVPAEELRELQMNVANAIDAGNHAMRMPMQIRDKQGKTIHAKDLSIVNAYKLHEQTSQKVQEYSQRILDPAMEDKLFTQSGGNTRANEWMLLISVDYSDFARIIGQQNAELVFGLGRASSAVPKDGQQTANSRAIRPLTEPLTIQLLQPPKENLARNKQPQRQCRALFVDLADSDLHDPANSLSLWMTALRMGPLANDKAGQLAAEEVRQFYAHGQVELGQFVKDMADKEQCELTLHLAKKFIPSMPNSSNAVVNSPTTNSAPNQYSTGERMKIAINLTVQLFAGNRDQLISAHSELRQIVQIRKLKVDKSGKFLPIPNNGHEEKRNEMFLWLRDGDLHGIGKSEKNIEAVISVVDDDGIFQPNAIEIVTPQGPIRESSFRCRVWPAEDRPRFNELIKVLLPEHEVCNLHLQILFYNKSIVPDKKAAFTPSSLSLSSSAAAKGPFALAFLRLIHNFVLCPDDEDELYIYRVDKAKAAGGAGELARALNVAYLANLSKRREARQPAGTAATTMGMLGSQRISASSFSSMATLSTKSGGSSNDFYQQNGVANNGNGIYSQCEKNGLHFQSFVCSQVHSSSLTFVQILRWRDNEPHVLRLRLLELINNNKDSNGAIGGEATHWELAKFFPHLLDALFQIADAHSQLQRPAFDAIVQMCGHAENGSKFGTTMQQQNQLHLKLMLEEYTRYMHHPNAHSFLLEHIIWYISNEPFGGGMDKHKHSSASILLQHRPSLSATSRDQLTFVLKSLGPLVRLALASKCCANLLNHSLNKAGNDAEQTHFIEQLNSLRSGLLLLLGNPIRPSGSQIAIIANLPSLILPLLENAIYEPLELANFVKDILDSISDEEGTLLRQKLLFLEEIITSALFDSQQCRHILLDRFLVELLAQMPPHVRQEEHNRALQLRGRAASDSSSANEQLEAVHLAATILANLLDRLFPYSRHFPVDQLGTAPELALILRRCLRPVNQTMITLLGDPSRQRVFHSFLLAILDKFTAQHFADYFDGLVQQLDRLDALTEMLHMFRDLILRCPVAPEWVQIRYLQFRLFLKHIRFTAGYIQREFAPGEHFEPEVWLECMLSCVMVVKLADDEGAQIMEEEDGMDEEDGGREEGEEEEEEKGICKFALKILRSLWHSLNPEAKLIMMEGMVGPILEVALCEDGHLRALAMPMFFDMLATEHWLTTMWGKQQQQPLLSSQQQGVVLRNNYQSTEKAANSKFGDEFIGQLDKALDTVVDEKAFTRFCAAFNRAYEEHQMRTKGGGTTIGKEWHPIRTFVQRINKLLELFSAYKSVTKSDDQMEMGMFCTVQLIDFYHSIGQNALYLVYLYKLYRLHISAGQWVEAALTLQRHSNLLKWTTDRPGAWLYGAKKENSTFGSQLALKEHLYMEMAELFTKGGHWELAIETNRELVNVYESIIFDYKKLSSLLESNAELYKKVIREIRLESNYFLVAFYGNECPDYLANRKFIFRGEQLELWGAFKQRLLGSTFAHYKFIDSMEDCDETMRNLPGKFIQIIAVSPILSPMYTALILSPSRLPSWYYRHHRVQRFELVRREFRHETKWTKLEDTESMTLWLHRKIIGIQRPLPDLLNFAPVTLEQSQDPMNPVEVAVEKVREANDKLADLTGRVEEGFGQFLMNLGGIIRGIVQADVGGGIRNYQVFFTSKCLAQCSGEEIRQIIQLKGLILEQITLLEFALFVHAGQEQARANPQFHNSLVESFHHHRHRVEGMFDEEFGGEGPIRARSVLPEGASIYAIGQTTMALAFGGENHLLAAPSNSAANLLPSSPNSSKATRSHSMSECQHRLNMNSSNFPSSSSIHPIQYSSTSASSAGHRPPSAVSQSNSSGSSGSNNLQNASFFRNSPLETASSLIRTTIQGKSKLKNGKKMAKKSISEAPAQMPSSQQNPQISGQFLSAVAFSQARASDASMENCCFPMDSAQLVPSLPPRLSNLHSNERNKKQSENTKI